MVESTPDLNVKVAAGAYAGGGGDGGGGDGGGEGKADGGGVEVGVLVSSPLLWEAPSSSEVLAAAASAAAAPLLRELATEPMLSVPPFTTFTVPPASTWSVAAHVPEEARSIMVLARSIMVVPPQRASERALVVPPQRAGAIFVTLFTSNY